MTKMNFILADEFVDEVVDKVARQNVTGWKKRYRGSKGLIKIMAIGSATLLVTHCSQLRSGTVRS